mgnify:FL=1
MFKNDDIFGNFEKNLNQKNIEKRRVRQEYRGKAENAIDNIARLVDNSRINGFQDYQIGEEFKNSIVRYYRNYWIKDMQKSLLAIAIIIFILSFYTLKATSLFILVFLIILVFSENTYIMRYFKIGDYSSKEIEKIKMKLFPKSYSFHKNIITWIIVSILSLIAYYFSNTLYIPQELANYLNVQTNQFKIENEFYAYSNFILILIVIFLRILKKI